MTTRAPVLELRSVTKRYGSVVANERVDLDVRRGEIHALVGENGAGKTTLMNILYGIVQPDEGVISLDGKRVVLQRPQDAIAQGIGMVHQHFMLVPSLTVLENITLGAEPRRRGLMDRKAAKDAIREPMARLGMPFEPDAVTGSLSVAAQQRLEIVKVLYRGARIIILDEPTAVLTPQETRELFVLLRQLAADGTSIIFISHKLREVFEIAERITVLRDGRSIISVEATASDPTAIVSAMTGRSSVNLGRVARGSGTDDQGVVIDVRGLCTEKPEYDAAVDDVSFTVRAGEIVGIAGVEGNGQSTLTEAIVGSQSLTAGSILLGGTELAAASVSERRDAGLAYVPEDRQREGIPLHGSVLEGLSAGRIRRLSLSRTLNLAMSAAIRSWGTEVVERYRIKTRDIDAPCMTLSGGNQQKIVMARELEEAPRALLLAQPTRGVDLGAIEFLYDRITDATSTGCAVLLISADLDEILRLADRVLVMYAGRVAAERTATETTREELGTYMMGTAPTQEFA